MPPRSTTPYRNAAARPSMPYVPKPSHCYAGLCFALAKHSNHCAATPPPRHPPRCYAFADACLDGPFRCNAKSCVTELSQCTAIYAMPLQCARSGERLCLSGAYIAMPSLRLSGLCHSGALPCHAVAMRTWPCRSQASLGHAVAPLHCAMPSQAVADHLM